MTQKVQRFYNFFMFSIKRKCYNVIYDIFHMISVRLLECLTPIMWKMDVISAGAGCLEVHLNVKKGEMMRDKIQNFLRGRYGTDSLSKFLLILALAGMFLPIFIKKAFVFYYAGLLLLIYSYFRIFSRNIAKRSAEMRHSSGRPARLPGFSGRRSFILNSGKRTSFSGVRAAVRISECRRVRGIS